MWLAFMVAALAVSGCHKKPTTVEGDWVMESSMPIMPSLNPLSLPNTDTDLPWFTLKKGGQADVRIPFEARGCWKQTGDVITVWAWAPDAQASMNKMIADMRKDHPHIAKLPIDNTPVKQEWQEMGSFTWDKKKDELVSSQSDLFGHPIKLTRG